MLQQDSEEWATKRLLDLFLALSTLPVLVFLWHCYRMGWEETPQATIVPLNFNEETPFGTELGSGTDCHLYRYLQDYAGRYSWSGMSRVHRGICRQSLNFRESRGVQNPGVFFLPNLPSAPYLSHDAQRHDVETLEHGFPAILMDFGALQQDFTNDTNSAVAAGWTPNPVGGQYTFYLYRKGVRVTGNCHSCPRTYRLLSSLRTFIGGNIFGSAGFSVLFPGVTLPAKCGPTNTRVRCQLGIKIPSGCELVVGGEPQCWAEGHCLLVDDSFLHTISHNGLVEDGPQVLFMVDLWHPNVAAVERQALDFIFASRR
ncbi:aspartate beta-hydroxylase domain-containing protein 1 [Microcaecilia unicolor]|uniref:Aspartate beta-hydroxylase domain-containing protein 1 n=1 Tax=Microcaecilia unicolor TaxID=1415580 RepID=A0A6P7YPK6_9AMPH|nr:aspartate beta-hydroxylase domain-containing protein 1 [Microcaecilia unicolor]